MPVAIPQLDRGHRTGLAPGQQTLLSGGGEPAGLKKAVDLAAGTRSAYTSPTNIGGYLWSTVVGRDLGLISRAEADRRAGATLATLARLPRHEASGMFYNWYDPHTGTVITTCGSSPQVGMMSRPTFRLNN